MSWYELLRPLAFALDAETVHETALKAITTGAFSARPLHDERFAVEALGLRFANPLGLAAGFDKNGVALRQWPAFGFGFVEIGTVTAIPQKGNPKPRLHRLPADQALINRLGFNNHGAEALAERLSTLPPLPIPFGINLGKSKACPLARAPEDYLKSFRFLSGYGDYFVINVSSPNTPGLRTLQDGAALREILAALQSENRRGVPILIKVAPDLEFEALAEVVAVALGGGAKGLIATNTTLRRDGLQTAGPYPAGGLSGAPLRARALEVMRFLAKEVPDDFTLIGVGGISSGRDLLERLLAGADLCQLYTGWVYGGPDTVPNILENLGQALDRAGVYTLKSLARSQKNRCDTRDFAL